MAEVLERLRARVDDLRDLARARAVERVRREERRLRRRARDGIEELDDGEGLGQGPPDAAGVGPVEARHLAHGREGRLLALEEGHGDGLVADPVEAQRHADAPGRRRPPVAVERDAPERRRRRRRRRRDGVRGEHGADAVAEAERVRRAAARRRESHGVAVPEERARRAVGEGAHVPGAHPGELEHGPVRARRRAGDRARRQQIARAHVAARDRVVDELLRRRPVEVAQVRRRDDGEGLRARGLQRDLQSDVVGPVARVVQVRERRRVLDPRRRRAAEGLQRVGRHDPAADRRREVLGAEGAQRHVLEFLDVARGPVVAEHEAEDALRRRRGVEGRAERVRRAADEEGHLELEVEEPAGAVRRALRRVGLVDLELALGPRHGRARGHDGRRAAVVADGHAEPVGLERVGRAAEHRADVRRVLLRRVKVRVVADGRGQVHGALAPRHEALARFGLARRARGEELADAGARRAPLGPRQRHERVERRAAEDALRGEAQAVEQALRRRGAQVQHAVADGDANARVAARRRVGEDAQRQVLDGELVVAVRGGDEGHRWWWLCVRVCSRRRCAWFWRRTCREVDVGLAAGLALTAGCGDSEQLKNRDFQ